ncbi:arginine--tRNA ligase [Candidatus Nitrosotenuis uzonensis]|uniref:Arginine--tRNA ligase n=1 Tax=Candidatus Nitrosotenuis uzonensis TaxID=1407055 RepID=A0A812F3V4_9ARCH|nr:arginine--tRNA ligase [Candidatus Nitrosotenuis uzonensis]MCA2003288.1 arginine--tRNA ligase [Candidatus Nitrosotenuis sp.]CAE6501201.1 Arginine--tRNA ligase [Candidatus Nitrosotenuis uzonensis]
MSIQVLLDEINGNLAKITAKLGIPQTNYTLEPAKEGYGDVTCNIAFLAAKHLKKTPYDVAKDLAEHYAAFVGRLVLRVEAHSSGYLNFFANNSLLSSIILKGTQEPIFGKVDLGKGAKIVVEHTSVNPNKALHIGHVRNVVIGDTVARILKSANYDVSVLNYVDDSGLQVADILVGFTRLGFSQTPDSGQKFDQYCGDVVYVKTTERYASEPELQDIRNKMLKEIEDGHSEIAKFAKTITARVLAEQLKTCWRLDVSYDCLNFESEIVRSQLWSEIFEKLKELGKIKFEQEGKNAGCWVIPAEGEDDKVLVRSNGTATYIAKDIPYAAWKLGLVDDPFNYKKYVVQHDGRILWQTTLEPSDLPKQNFSADNVITVIDSRQARLQNIITKLVSDFGSGSKSYLHLGYESVTLSSDTAKALGIDTGGKNTQMSGRKGLYVNADSVLDMLEQKIIEETKKRNPDFTAEILAEIAEKISVGTIRYEMIKQDLDKIITFDLTKSLSLEGDTASYIQYSYVRATRILEKAATVPNFEASYDLLASEYELSLIRAIGKFSINIRDAANNLSPKVIARYCYSLAVEFNAFYEHVRVLDSDDGALLNARLCLLAAFKSCLQKALDLLGISVPQRM